MNARSVVLPENFEAERAVLGEVMFAAHTGEHDALGSAIEALGSDAFVRPGHRLIWAAIASLYREGSLPDLISVTERLRQQNQLEAADGAAYVTELLNPTYTTGLLDGHVKLLRDLWAKRATAELASHVTEAALNGHSVEALTSLLGRGLDQLREFGFPLPSLREGSWEKRIEPASALLEAEEHLQQWFPLWGQAGLVGPDLVTLVSGHSKVAGKSTSLAAGLRTLTEQFPDLRILVLSEEPRSVWVRRLATWPVVPPGLLFRFADGTPWPTLLREIDAIGPSIVLIDTLRSFAGIIDENDASRVVIAMQPLSLLARRRRLAAIVAHHLRKGEGDSGLAHSGSTALVALVDVACELRAESEHSPTRRTLRVVSRFDESPKSLLLELRGSEIVVLGTPAAVSRNEVAARVQDALGDDWLTTQQVHEALGDPRPAVEQVRKALGDLFVEGRVERQGSGKRGSPFRWKPKDSTLLRHLLVVGETNSAPAAAHGVRNG